MKKRTIYGQQSQELLRLYEEAGTHKKVLVGAIDYANPCSAVACDVTVFP